MVNLEQEGSELLMPAFCPAFTLKTSPEPKVSPSSSSQAFPFLQSDEDVLFSPKEAEVSGSKAKVQGPHSTRVPGQVGVGLRSCSCFLH